MKFSKLQATGNDFTLVDILTQILYIIDIMLIGRTLTVSWDRVGETLLSSPAKEVFTGESLKGKN